MHEKYREPLNSIDFLKFDNFESVKTEDLRRATSTLSNVGFILKDVIL